MEYKIGVQIKHLLIKKITSHKWNYFKTIFNIFLNDHIQLCDSR